MIRYCKHLARSLPLHLHLVNSHHTSYPLHVTCMSKIGRLLTGHEPGMILGRPKNWPRTSKLFCIKFTTIQMRKIDSAITRRHLSEPMTSTSYTKYYSFITDSATQSCHYNSFGLATNRSTNHCSNSPKTTPSHQVFVRLLHR
jgi:hypothetical protein